MLQNEGEVGKSRDAGDGDGDYLGELAYIKKLLKIVETYPVNGYFYQIHLYYCSG